LRKVGWLAAIAFTFAMLSLIVLAVTPAVMFGRIARETSGITQTVLPAYNALSGFLFAMEERNIAARTASFTGDTAYATRSEDAKERESAALDSLIALDPRYGPRFSAHLAHLKQLIARRDSLGEIIRSHEEHIARLPEFDALHDSMLVDAIGLEQELVRSAQEQAAEIARVAKTQGQVSIALGILAAMAGIVVGWFAWREARQRRRTEAALDEARHLRELAEQGQSELTRINESRIRLLRGVTHDVKNPIGAAKGYAELLAMGVAEPLRAEQQTLVQGIGRTLDDALGIIDDLLDIARAESGGLAIRQEPLDLRLLVNEAVENHRATVQASGHTISLETPPRPVPIRSDRARIRQVIDNLLSNAIKYTPPPGHITVSTEVDEAPDKGGPRRARVRVTDTGPGIPPGMRDIIFDEFSRVGDTGVKGHGLGLAISRRIARMLGGDLILTDTDRPGATFVFWLPLDDRPHDVRHDGNR